MSSCAKPLGGRVFRVLWLAIGAGVLAWMAAAAVQDSLAQPAASGRLSADPNARPPATRPAGSRPATTSSSQSAATAALVTQEQFLKVMQQSCVRCHQGQCSSVDSLKRAKWLVPGKPDASPVFKVIGVNNAGRTYHNLSPRDKRIVRDFIEQMKG